MLPKFQWWELSIQNISFLHEMRWSSQMVITFEPCVIWHWKKSQNEEIFIGFHLQLNCSFAIAKNAHFMAISLVQKKIIFSHKNWKQVKHELVTWWSWYFLSNLFLRLSSTHAWFLHTLGAHNIMTKKTMTTYVGCVSFDKKQYSIFKGRFLPIMHTVQI